MCPQPHPTPPPPQRKLPGWLSRYPRRCIALIVLLALGLTLLEASYLARGNQERVHVAFALDFAFTAVLAFLLGTFLTRTVKVEQWVAERTEALAKANASLTQEVAQRTRIAEELRRRSEELAESEERYRLVAEQTGQIVYDLQPGTGQGTRAGDLQGILGYSGSELNILEGAGWLELVHPEDRGLVKAQFQSAQARPERFSLAYRLRRKDGSYAHMLDRGVSLADPQGRVRRVVGTVADTEPLRRAQDATRNHLRFLEALLNTIPAPVFYLDKEGVYRLCNDALAKQILGMPIELILGKTMAELVPAIPASMVEVYRRRDEELLAAGGIQTYETPVLCCDGEVREFYATKAVFRGETGEPEGIIGVLLDITSRRRAEEELRKLWLAVEQSPATVAITDASGTIQYANQRFAETSGHSLAEARGQNPRFLKSGHHSPEFYRELWQTISGGRQWRGELCNRRKDGSLYWESASISPVRSQGGEITHFIAIKEDITARRQAAEELRRAEAALRQREVLLRTMTSVAPLAFYVVDNRTDAILYYNRQFCEIWGLAAWQERLAQGSVKNGDLIADCLARVADQPVFIASCKPLQDENNRAVVEDEIEFTDGRTIRRFSTQVRDPEDRYFGRLYLFEDITRRKEADRQRAASLKEKEILLREVYHRVKNNLQVISSLLNLQSNAISDGRTLRLIRETQDRVRSMALVHEKLYRAKDLSRIDFKDYTHQLVTMLARSYRTDARPVEIQFDMESVPLNLDTSVPCGLILNELVSNALKYAFPPTLPAQHRARLTLGLRTTAVPDYELTISDNGVGLPAHLDVHNTATLGLQVVSLLAEQLGGKVEVRRAAGTTFVITFREVRERSTRAAETAGTDSPRPLTSLSQAAPGPTLSAA